MLFEVNEANARGHSSLGAGLGGLCPATQQSIVSELQGGSTVAEVAYNLGINEADVDAVAMKGSPPLAGLGDAAYPGVPLDTEARINYALLSGKSLEQVSQDFGLSIDAVHHFARKALALPPVQSSRASNPREMAAQLEGVTPAQHREEYLGAPVQLGAVVPPSPKWPWLLGAAVIAGAYFLKR